MARLRILADHWFDGSSLRNDAVSIDVDGECIGRIETTAEVTRGAPADGRTLIDARGKLLAPGLVNAHVHIARGGMFEPEEPLGLTQASNNMRDALAAGVTTVGDMGCAAPLAASLRALARAHPTLAPALVASGPLVTAPGGYPLDWMPPLFVKLGLALPCSDEKAAARAVSRIAASGMDHVKLAIMHESYAEKPLPALRVPVARAAVAEAHALGLRAVAHAHSVADYEVAIAAGVDALMHSSFEPIDADLLARVRDAGIPVCPTLWVFESTCMAAEMRFDRDPRFSGHVIAPIRRSWARFIEAWNASGDVVPPGIAGGAGKARARASVRVAAANLKLLRDANVPIAFGNDANYGFSLVARPIDELSAMQRAGMSAEDCLRSATTEACSLLGLDDRGRIATGARADLVLLDSKAAHDIDFADRVSTVIAAGEVVPLRAAAPSLGDARRAFAVARGIAGSAVSGLRSMLAS